MSSAPSPALSALSALQPAASPGAPETRRRLLGAALAVFGRYGYRRASMEAVAAEAGISRQGLYRHYAGKEALFAAAISHLHDRGDDTNVGNESEEAEIKMGKADPPQGACLEQTVIDQIVDGHGDRLDEDDRSAEPGGRFDTLRDRQERTHAEEKCQGKVFGEDGADKEAEVRFHGLAPQNASVR